MERQIGHKFTMEDWQKMEQLELEQQDKMKIQKVQERMPEMLIACSSSIGTGKTTLPFIGYTINDTNTHD